MASDQVTPDVPVAGASGPVRTASTLDFQCPFSKNDEVKIHQIYETVDEKLTSCIKGNIWCQVWKEEPYTTYQSQGKTKEFQHLYLVDDTGAMKAYNYTRNELLKEGRYVVITDVLTQNNVLKITSVTKAFKGMQRPIPEGSIEKAERLLIRHTTRQLMTVEEALDAAPGTMFHLKAKIVKASTLSNRVVKDDDTPYRELRVRDNSGTTTLSCWHDMARITFEEGNIVEFKNLTVSKYKQAKRFSTVDRGIHKTSIEFTVDETFNLEVSSSDEEGPVYVPCDLIQGTLQGIAAINEYPCCLNKTCHGKKLLGNNCEKCGLFYRAGATETGMATTMIIKRIDNSKLEHITVFKKHLAEIWSNISPLDFPKTGATIVEAFLQEELSLQYRRNDKLIMTSVQMQNRNHPQ